LWCARRYVVNTAGSKPDDGYVRFPSGNGIKGGNVADLIAARSVQRNTTIAGAAGLFGWLMGLFAIFGLVATAVDWREEIAQSGWPLVSAVIDRGDVTATRSAQSNGGVRTASRIRYVVRYQADGQNQNATLTSRSVYSDADAAKLRGWAAQHRPGSHIDVRYDPAQPDRAVFASANVPDAGPQTGKDLILSMAFALACVGLLALAKHLRLKEVEAMAAGDADGSPLGRIVLGIVFTIPGLVAIGSAMTAAIRGTGAPLSETLIGVPAGLIFVIGGALLALPPGRTRIQGLLTALLVTCFALTFDWVAFGPGERKFSGGFSIGGIGTGFQPGELFGRAFFGFFAILLDICAIAIWVDKFRRLSSPDASGASIEQDAR